MKNIKSSLFINIIFSLIFICIFYLTFHTVNGDIIETYELKIKGIDYLANFYEMINKPPETQIIINNEILENEGIKYSSPDTETLEKEVQQKQVIEKPKEYEHLFDGCPKNVGGPIKYNKTQNFTNYKDEKYTYKDCEKFCNEDALCNIFEVNNCEGSNKDPTCEGPCYLYSSYAPYNYKKVVNGNCDTSGKQKTYKKIEPSNKTDDIKFYGTWWVNQDYKGFKKKCENKGRRLPTFDELCPSGKGELPVGKTKTEDTWTPILTQKNGNEWVQIGNRSGGTCNPLSTYHGSQGSWMTNKFPTGYKGVFSCAKLSDQDHNEPFIFKTTTGKGKFLFT
jgi:hypothetical protein